MAQVQHTPFAGYTDALTKDEAAFAGQAAGQGHLGAVLIGGKARHEVGGCIIDGEDGRIASDAAHESVGCATALLAAHRQQKEGEEAQENARQSWRQHFEIKFMLSNQTAYY